MAHILMRRFEIKSSIQFKGLLLSCLATGIAASALVLSNPAFGEEETAPTETKLLDAFGGGTVSLGLRYRFEEVADDDPRYACEDGYASTLRTALRYDTATFRGFTASLEFENVTDLGLDNQHNNLGQDGFGNGITVRPGIADPEITEVNQVYLQFERIPHTIVDLGRREMRLADERFLGPVGWRQNHQSFDGIYVAQKSIPRTTLVYAFLHNVNRIFGDNLPMASHLLDATVSVGDRVNIAPYAYYLDYQRARNAALSTLTLGVRGTGVLALSETWRLPFHLEAAWQQDTAANPRSYEVTYYRMRAGLENGVFSAGWEYEVLGGKSDEGAFATPLATLHKFNGWADKFLNTPANGLRDLSVVLKAKRKGLSGILAAHDYSADSGGATYGQEIDVQVSYKTSWKQTVATKLAFYYADEYSNDTNKLWLYTTYGF